MRCTDHNLPSSPSPTHLLTACPKPCDMVNSAYATASCAMTSNMQHIVKLLAAGAIWKGLTADSPAVVMPAAMTPDTPQTPVYPTTPTAAQAPRVSLGSDSLAVTHFDFQKALNAVNDRDPGVSGTSSMRGLDTLPPAAQMTRRSSCSETTNSSIPSLALTSLSRRASSSAEAYSPAELRRRNMAFRRLLRNFATYVPPCPAEVQSTSPCIALAVGNASRVFYEEKMPWLGPADGSRPQSLSFWTARTK